MAKLENRIKRTAVRLENEEYKSVEEFYALIHHLDRLQARYCKHHGFKYNPHRDDKPLSIEPELTPRESLDLQNKVYWAVYGR